MGFVKIVSISVAVVILAIIVQRLIRTPVNQRPPPEWRNFGRLSDEQARKAQKAPPRPFKIEVSDEDINFLRQRLQSARLPPALHEEANMTYGYPSSGLDTLRQSMLQFDMRKWAAEMNTFNHYKRSLYGLDIHYIKVPAKQGMNSVPLLLLHGWPGSVYEFYDSIPLLQSKAEKSGFSFDIIIPSMPGYGWSEPSYRVGCGPAYVAAVYAELMEREFPGQKFVVQGGDWGSFTTGMIVGHFSDRLLGFHVNMFIAPDANHDLRIIPWQIVLSVAPSYFLSEKEAFLLDRHGFYSGTIWFLLAEGGYFHIQATKPDTVGAGLSDSPLGMAAYIMEKFYTATIMETVNMPLAEATKSLPFTVDKALNNVMVYWHSNSIASSARLYKEGVAGDLLTAPFETTRVPAGVLMNRNEQYTPRQIVELKYTNLKRYTTSLTGGHFAAFEEPDKFSTEIVAFVQTLLQ